MLICSCLAVTAGRAAEAPVRREATTFDGAAVVNIGPWTPATRKEQRPPELWRHYMHGIVDHFATPVSLKAMLGDDQPAERWLAGDQPIRNPFKESDLPAIRCRRSDSIELARPVPLPLPAVRGKRVRFFVWMKGDDVGARNNTWHCPSMIVVFKDAAGKVLASGDAYFKTQRTFPWHCYYTDRFVPEAAAGVYLRFYNKFHGTASFGTVSWEPVTEQNTCSADERQDPYTGSLAKNPLYDPLAYHLTVGFGFRYPWRFVLGDKIGMKGHTYDITTKEGFRRYYMEKAKHHPDEMNHGILYLQSLYRNGMKHNLLPPMEEGWLQNFADILIADQDPETGFWHDGRRLSLGLTFHLCDMHFRYYGIPRADREDLIYPGQDLGLRRVPRADRIIRSVLQQQSSWTDPDGVTRKAAWNRAAYGYITNPDDHEQKCYLGSTWDAIYLIRLASRYVDPGLQEQVYESVRDAFHYVLRVVVDDDGLYRQHDTDPHPTNGQYMGGILRDVSWLERRVRPDIPQPRVDLVRAGEGVSVTWRSPAAPQNSLRVYAAPADVAPEHVDESFLVGVVHRRGAAIHERDPFIAVQDIRRAMARRWGASMELPPPTHWRGRKYLPWKLRKISYPLARADGLAPLELGADTIGGKVLYVSAATWYGEESPLARPESVTPGDADAAE